MKYRIGQYIIDSKSPMKAHEAVKMIRQYNKQRVKDDYITKTVDLGKYRRYDTLIMKKANDYSIKLEGEDNIVKATGNIERINDFIEFINKYHSAGAKLKDSKVKDEAFDRSTLEALISDEQAAIDSYNVAIANLKGKLSDEAIKVLQAIRDDEQNHVANLNAILSNNITEKNLEDSVDDASNQEFYEVTRLAEEIAHKANKEDYQAVGNLCYNLIQYLKSHKLAK